MPTQTLTKRSGPATRRRILEAAVQRFTQASYEQVGLRDVAADAGVDVALVHRAFGSKERLFKEAFEATVHTERLLAAEDSALGTVFAQALYEPVTSYTSKSAALQIFAHSLSSPMAAEVLRNFTMQNLVEPLAGRTNGRSMQRAALFAACLAGIAIMRDVLRIEPLLDITREETEPMIAQLLASCLADESGLDETPPPVSDASDGRPSLGRS